MARVDHDIPPQSNPNHFNVIRSFNGMYHGYRQIGEAMLQKADSGDQLTEVERRFAIDYMHTSSAIRLITHRVPRLGQDALIPGRSPFHWLNLDHPSNLFTAERIPMNGPLFYLENFAEEEEAQDWHDVLAAASHPYTKVHFVYDDAATAKKLLADRVNQEIGFIHGNPLTDDREYCRQSWEHEEADRRLATDIITTRLELLVPPFELIPRSKN